MAGHILTDAGIWVGAYDLKGISNQGSVEESASLVEDPVFGDVAKRRKKGLLDVTGAARGYFDAVIDAGLKAKVGLVDEVVTFSAPDTAEGSDAAFFQAAAGEYVPFDAAHGAMIGYSLGVEASGGDGLIHGTIMVHGTKIATADGTGRQLGAVSATQKLYAALHVVEASESDTLDVIVESDAADNWIGSETTRITFAQKTAIGAEYASPIAGPITDTWFRIGWTIGGAGPSFKFIVTVGIK